MQDEVALDDLGAAAAEEARTGRTIGLASRVALVIAVVLLIVALGAGYLAHQRQMARQAEVDYRAAATLQSLLDARVQGEVQRLWQLSAQASYHPYIQALLASGISTMQQDLEARWLEIGPVWGVATLAIFDPGNRLQAAIGEDPDASSRSPVVLGWVRQINASSGTVSAVLCGRSCRVYLVSPLPGGRGVLLLGADLRGVLGELQDSFSAESAVLVPGGSGPWGMGLAEQSTPELEAIINQAAATAPLPVPGSALAVDTNSGLRAMLTVRLPLYAEDPPALGVFLRGTGSGAVGGFSAARDAALAGLVALLLVSMATFLVMLGPLKRLTAVREGLVALGRLDFRAAWGVLIAAKGGNDEAGQLARQARIAVRALAMQHKDLRTRLGTVEAAARESAVERRFLSVQLQSAPVAIFTLGSDGRIATANAAAQALTGYSEAELVGKDFIDRLFPNGLPGLRWSLKEMFSSSRNRPDTLRHDALISGKAGVIRNVTWLHSLIGGRNDKDHFVLSVGVDTSERRSNEARLAWMAEHDPLTGLLNRRHFIDEFELSLRGLGKQNGVLMLVALDQYQQLNDSGGHQRGDLILKVVARQLTEGELKPTLGARLGGDELALFYLGADESTAADIVAALNRAASSASHGASDRIETLTVSAGAVSIPLHGLNAQELLTSADLALYKAKEQAPGSCHIYSEEDKTWERVRQRAYWKDKVQQALANDRFVLYFQPIIDLKSGRIAYFEVLLRMLDDKGGVISAAQFIQAAERGGMIHAVDRLVISKAFEALSLVNLRGLNVGFTIHLSGEAFSDPQLLPHIKRQFEKHPVEPGNVIFEIAETAAVADFSVASSVMLSVKELGCRFALDNFGVGFSSFYYLKHLPVDFLKIDGTFIRQLAQNLDDQIIVQIMGQTAKGFGKQTIAETVEDERALDLLKSIGIDFAQGYHISRPLSADDAFKKVEKDG